MMTATTTSGPLNLLWTNLHRTIGLATSVYDSEPDCAKLLVARRQVDGDVLSVLYH